MLQTFQDMYESDFSLLEHQIWKTWCKIRGQNAEYVYHDKSEFLRRTYLAFWSLIFYEVNQIWCSKRLQSDFYMSWRVCNVFMYLLTDLVAKMGEAVQLHIFI